MQAVSSAMFSIIYMVMSQHWKVLHLTPMIIDRFKADCWRNVARRRYHDGGKPGLLAQDGGEISWYFQVGEVMKEVNAFFGM